MKYPVYMHQPEIDLIEQNIWGSVLEWGCGGSTLYFSSLVDEYYSIEHDWKWYSKISLEAFKEKRENVYLSYVDNEAHFIKYITYPDNFNQKFQSILIDGRFRTACAIKALDYLTKEGLLFFHDFFQRSYYWSILDYYEIVDKIETGQTLAILKPK